MGQIIALPIEPRYPRGVDDNVAHLVAHGLVYIDLEQQPGRIGATRATVALGGHSTEAWLRIQKPYEPNRATIRAGLTQIVGFGQFCIRAGFERLLA